MAQANTKHVGALANTGTRCVVMMRQLPDDRDSALIMETESFSLIVKKLTILIINCYKCVTFNRCQNQFKPNLK